MELKHILERVERIEKLFARFESRGVETTIIDEGSPPIRLRHPPKGIVVNLPDAAATNAGRAALRDVQEWVEETAATLPERRHAALRVNCDAALRGVAEFLKAHDAMVARGLDNMPRIMELRQLVEGNLSARMFDLRDCLERIGRACAEAGECPAERPEAPPAEKPGPAAAASAAPEPTPKDGPQPPNLLRWQGKTHELQVLQWRLLNYMWDKETVHEEDLITEVWGHEGMVQGSTVRSTLSRLNTFLLDQKVGLDWRLSQKAGYVVKSR